MTKWWKLATRPGGIFEQTEPPAPKPPRPRWRVMEYEDGTFQAQHLESIGPPAPMFYFDKGPRHATLDEAKQYIKTRTPKQAHPA